jgi:ferredoxin-type protein NapH
VSARLPRLHACFLAAVLVAVVFIIVGLMQGDLDFIRHTNTYGNFDISGIESWVGKLQPGIADAASDVVYGPFKRAPLIAIGTLFAVTLVLSTFRLYRDLLSRKLVQWAVFVTARLGVLRVAGVCPVKRNELGVFPFLNCMGCEMATGACPIGTLQWGLIQGRVVLLALGTVLLSAALLGRTICGWLCPFGFISDLFDRISLRKIKPQPYVSNLRFGLLALIPFVSVWGIPVFCVYLCQSGVIYGLLPYYLTTGQEELRASLATQAWLGSLLGFHILSFGLLMIGFIALSGRWFCRYVCPLGAFYGLFNYISPIKVVHDEDRCTHCGRCTRTCPMAVDLRRGAFTDVTGCIRCGRCTTLCRARRFHVAWPWLAPAEQPRAGRIGAVQGRHHEHS